MPVSWRFLSRFSRPLVGVALVLGLSACTSDLPQTTLYPKGTSASLVHDLLQPIFWTAVAVFVIVEGLLVYSVARFRSRRDPKAIPFQLHGNTPLEIAWTIAPAIVLGIIFFLTVSTINAVGDLPKSANAINVRVIGHQWWWEFQYPDLKLVTASDMHIPAGQTVAYTLESVDVIHSFWVPQLGGKTDLIPGHINKGSFSADQPGEFFGQCAEFCGQQHAQMRFHVIADTAADFQAWVKNQQSLPPALAGKAKDGADLFAKIGCAGCHTIAGTNAIGLVGPNLTHFGSRNTIAAGVLANTPDNLRAWLRDPEKVKPGNDMSAFMTTTVKGWGASAGQNIDLLVEYLTSLK
ncbi:MAG: cytochrome c oxidase subunit II [Chloroflexi bacterium]|nr:cytochrome c oxidase subunit II [Chloroflexota bacterium]